MVPVAPRSCSYSRSIWDLESLIIWQVPHKLAYFSMRRLEIGITPGFGY